MTTLTSAILTGTVCDQYLSRSSFVTAVVRFEAALARAQAALGVIPADAADAIEAAARGFSPDLGTIAAKGHDAGTPVVEILVQLGEAVERQREGAGRFMHAGATSQDALDTAMVLCVKPCVQLALEALGASRRAAFDLARKHADSPVLARTLMQAAGVTTFGATAANWGLALGRCEKRLREAAEEGLHVQLGGPVSTGASFGDRWPELRNAVARELGLAAGPAGTWQSARDAWTNLLMQLGLATGIAAKICGRPGAHVADRSGRSARPFVRRRSLVGDAAQTKSRTVYAHPELRAQRPRPDGEPALDDRRRAGTGPRHVAG